MEKKELEKLINELFLPVGFKKKGNYWIKTQDEITKMIYLQKSQFSNSFYINYGYILNSISLGNLRMHVFNGFGSILPDENESIKELLNFENNLFDEIRLSQLKRYLIVLVLEQIQKVNTEKDILNELLSRPHLNDIPFSIKQHFHLD